MKLNLPELKQTYNQMAEHTKTACEQSCNNPYSCCAPYYCELTIKFAKEYRGIDLEPTEHFKNGLTNLSMLGIKNGVLTCTAEPYLRPMCSLHYCEINSLGIKLHDPEWTRKYYDLREEIDKLELEIFETKENEINLNNRS